MVFSNLSVSFNRQTAIQFSRNGLDSLRRWITFVSEGLQNQFDVLQAYSPRSAITLIGMINALFFWRMRNLGNRLEISLVQSSPAVADIRSATTSVLVGVAVGALNFGLSRLCRFHLSLLTLCTISSSTIALHLFLKQPVIIRQPSALTLPPSRLPSPSPLRNHAPKPKPKANPVRYDLTTPAPSPRPQTITTSAPIFSPPKLPGQLVKPRPVLNTQDYAQIRGAALIKMAELTKKKQESPL